MEFVDAIRGYAILGVLIVHSSQNGLPLDSSLGNLLAIKGARGVQLFFMASAMTLFYSYNARLRDEDFSVKNFFIRRFFRIAPMFYVAIIYYLFQKLHAGNNMFTIDNTGNILSAFTFTQSIHPYWVSGLVPGGWSISVEFLFYLVLPLLFLKIKNIEQALNLFICSLFIRVGCNYFLDVFPLIKDSGYWDSFLIYYLPNQFPVFCIGIFLYFLIFKNEKNVLQTPYGFLSLMAISLFEMASGYHWLIPEHVSFSLILASFIWILSRYPNVLLVNPIINYIGKISFSIYVVHFAVFYWLNYFQVLDLASNTYINYFIKLILVCLISVVLSTLFYNIIEVPFQRVGKQIISRKKTQLAS